MGSGSTTVKAIIGVQGLIGTTHTITSLPWTVARASLRILFGTTDAVTTILGYAPTCAGSLAGAAQWGDRCNGRGSTYILIVGTALDQAVTTPAGYVPAGQPHAPSTWDVAVGIRDH